MQFRTNHIKKNESVLDVRRQDYATMTFTGTCCIIIFVSIRLIRTPRPRVLIGEDDTSIKRPRHPRLCFSGCEVLVCMVHQYCGILDPLQLCRSSVVLRVSYLQVNWDTSGGMDSNQ